jgi:hypothetical protein
LAFSEALAGALETLQVVAGLVDAAQDRLAGDELDLAGALDKAVQAEKVLATLGAFRGARFVALLGRRIVGVREEIAREVRDVWGRLVCVDVEKKKISVHKEIEGE